MVPVLLLVCIGTFLLLQLVPGDPVLSVIGIDFQPDDYARVRKELGVDKPVIEQFFAWMGRTVQGDLGNSLFPPRQQVTELIWQRLPVTLQIAALSLLLSLAIALPVALASAYRPGQRFDRTATGLAFGAISLPGFFIGLLIVFFFVFHQGIVKALVAVAGAGLVLVVARQTWRRAREPDRGAVQVGLIGAGGVLAIAGLTAALVAVFPEFPRQGYVRITEGGIGSNLRSIALPVLMLSITEAAVFIRLLRADLLATMSEDFILFARAKGMPPLHILTRAALRPSLISLVTVISVTIGRVIGGTVIAETIFNLPGMGRLIIGAIQRKDYPIVQASVLLVALVYILSSVVVDVVYTVLDPRIRRARS
jgi:peptide/nickel transport system permease protein